MSTCGCDTGYLFHSSRWWRRIFMRNCPVSKGGENGFVVCFVASDGLLAKGFATSIVYPSF